jgi:hypothetical protein
MGRGGSPGERHAQFTEMLAGNTIVTFRKLNVGCRASFPTDLSRADRGPSREARGQECDTAGTSGTWRGDVPSA